MAEPVEWSPDGTPRSPRFGDVYRPRTGALEQARQVFLGGCGLPAAWAGQPRWCVLETGFGLGLNFLATWRAWRDDPARPALLHFAAIEAFPVSADDVRRSAEAHPELRELADELAAQWWGLTPGFHRLAFEGWRVLLTLCVGDAAELLPEQAFAADSVFLDGFDPLRNPQMWALPVLQAVARCCRRGTALASWTASSQVRRDLQTCGFVVTKVPGVPPKRESLHARYEPAWTPRGGPPEGRRAAGRAIVVGAGLAGAAAAASLARRGWRVQVLDAAEQPASGASGLPAGLLAPHTSPDDNLLSRLSRAGVRVTLGEAARLLRGDVDWQRGGSLEVQVGDRRPLPDLGPGGSAWQQARDDGVWHEAAAWIRPAALVRAWLANEGIEWRGRSRVTRLARTGEAWSALDAHGDVIATADLVVVAAALGSGELAPGVPLALNPVRGQVSWGPMPSGDGLPSHPLNGNGHFLPGIPLPDGPAWLSGSTYSRGDRGLDVRPQDQAANFERLRGLSPSLAARLRPQFDSGEVRAWTGTRCASSDRRPLVGELAPGLWVSTAMGSRGLTFAALCAELLCARLHGEPWPLPRRLGRALDAARPTRPGRGTAGP